MNIEKQIDDYIFNSSDLLGKGNFSRCYKGTHQKTKERVAIKIVELSTLNTKKLVELLQQEIQILRSINCPHILKCHQVFNSTRNCYIITELCDCTLEDLMKLNGTFNQTLLRPILLDIFQGMLYLASKNIVHRDLKISNVLLKENKVKIADFGFAKYSAKNFIDANIGSPLYMSPQGLIHHSYGPKSDVWAFGVMIYELLHGTAPLSRCKSESQLKSQICKPLTESDISAPISAELKEVMLKCLTVNQQKRYSFQELACLPYFAGREPKAMPTDIPLNVIFNDANKRKSKQGTINHAKSCDKDFKFKKLEDQSFKKIQNQPFQRFVVQSPTKVKKINTYVDHYPEIKFKENNKKQDQIFIARIQSPKKVMYGTEHLKRENHLLDTYYVDKVKNKTENELNKNNHKTDGMINFNKILGENTLKNSIQQKNFKRNEGQRNRNKLTIVSKESSTIIKGIYTENECYKNIQVSTLNKDLEKSFFSKNSFNQVRTDQDYFKKNQNFSTVSTDYFTQSQHLSKNDSQKKDIFCKNIYSTINSSSQFSQNGKERVLSTRNDMFLKLNDNKHVSPQKDIVLLPNTKDNIHKVICKDNLSYAKANLTMINQSSPLQSMKEKPTMFRNEPIESIRIEEEIDKNKILKTNFLTFRGCVNLLHYCRIIFKYLHLNFDQAMATITLKLLGEIMQILNNKNISQKDNKQHKTKKLREVTEEYYKKYQKSFKGRILSYVTLQQIIQKCNDEKNFEERINFIAPISKYSQILKDCAKKGCYTQFQDIRQLEGIIQELSK